MKVNDRQKTRAEKAGEAFGAENAGAVSANPRSIQALECLKGRLLAGQLAKVQDDELRQRLRRAADDSASLAWATPIPLLALPELLTEKAHEAFHQFKRQQAINIHRREPVELAA